uniref:Uncharacterized protein n=1 Tax=Ornithorhynchus anatinus TaxID=9258 RepID=A0A6I8PBT1_ORNAN
MLHLTFSSPLLPPPLVIIMMVFIKHLLCARRCSKHWGRWKFIRLSQVGLTVLMPISQMR